ncbi:MAG: hypothetical protein GY703_16420 [Gammaproteobacteria bacterium]|nr:hypothetical protein [Gammaproteobacteria bacterium]
MFNTDNDVTTMTMGWTINDGSQTTLGVPLPTPPNGPLTVAPGSSLDLVGTGQALPVTIITEIADFLLSVFGPGQIEILGPDPINNPNFPFTETFGTQANPILSLTITDPGYNSRFDFTRILTDAGLLVYDSTVVYLGAPGDQTDPFYAIFDGLDGSRPPAFTKDGRIINGYELNARVTQTVPAPPALWLMMLGMVGVYRFSKRS